MGIMDNTVKKHFYCGRRWVTLAVWGLNRFVGTRITPRILEVLHPGLELGTNVQIRGLPILSLAENARVSIGAGVLLDSNNGSYHVNMHSPVKIMADRPGAIVTVGEETRIHGTCIHAYGRIAIGKRCLIAANTQIIDNSGHPLSFDCVEKRTTLPAETKPVEIGDDVWIGANSFVLPGTILSSGCVVSAGSIVSGCFPDRSLIAGNPAGIVGRAGDLFSTI